MKGNTYGAVTLERLFGISEAIVVGSLGSGGGKGWSDCKKCWRNPKADESASASNFAKSIGRLRDWEDQDPIKMEAPGERTGEGCGSQK